MEGTGANLRLPLNPPFFFESVQLRRRRPARDDQHGFHRLVPLDTPSGQVRAWDPNLRPQFTQQWNVFVEYLLTAAMSVNVGYVGHDATHLVAPVEGNQPLPGVGDPSTWAPSPAAPPAFATAAARHHHHDDRARAERLQRAADEPPPARHERARVPRLVHLRRTRPTTSATTGGPACRRGRVWMNTYEPEYELRPRLLRRAPQLRLLGQLRAAVRQGAEVRQRLHRACQCGPRRLDGGHLPGAPGFPLTVTTARPSLQGPRGRAAELRRRPEAGDQTIDEWLDINAFQRAAAALSATPASGSLGRRATPTSTSCSPSGSHRRRSLSGVQGRGLQPDQHSELRAPGARHHAPNTFGLITNTVSSPRTVELVLKFFF